MYDASLENPAILETIKQQTHKNSKQVKKQKLAKTVSVASKNAKVKRGRKRGHSQRNNVLAPMWSWGLGILKWKMSKQAHQSQRQPQNQWNNKDKQEKV